MKLIWLCGQYIRRPLVPFLGDRWSMSLVCRHRESCALPCGGAKRCNEITLQFPPFLYNIWQNMRVWAERFRRGV